MKNKRIGKRGWWTGDINGDMLVPVKTSIDGGMIVPVKFAHDLQTLARTFPVMDRVLTRWINKKGAPIEIKHLYSSASMDVQ